MPDLQEVFRMSTQKVKPDPGALERQLRRQRRRSVGKKVAAFAVAAAVGLVVVALILVMHPGRDTTTPASEPSPVNPADAAAVKVATGFLGAFGAFDAEKAMTYVADDADITGMTEGSNDAEGLSLMLSFLEAQGYQQTITSCDATTLGSHTTVVCAYDFHGIRSDEIGRGPFSGGTFTLTVRDGEITRASRYWEIKEFSPQMWEPFRDWVSSTYPKDLEVMYTDGGTNFRLTEESIRLWERRTREYVKEVKRSTEEGALPAALEVDYVINLNTGVRTPLPEGIIRTAGETAEGGWPAWLRDACSGMVCAKSRYVASPDGSLLAYVGTGDEGTPQIFIAGIDGAGVRQMTHEPIGATWPAWSPDGTMIAYARVGSEGVTNLLVLDVATGESTQVTDETGISDGLQFTPDGASLIYTGGTRSGTAVLRTVPVAGGRSKLLIGPEGDAPGDLADAGNGSLSPDGSLLTFTGPEIPTDVERWVANADGTGRRSLGGCYDSIPAGTWSPDGSRIVCNEAFPPTYKVIIVVDVATGDARRVARGRAAIWLDDHTLLVEA